MKYLGVPQSGSQANTTASRNRYGQYYRNRSTPVNPGTPVQSARRASFAALAQAWKALTQSQRDAWNVFAADNGVVDVLGTTIFLTGASMFLRLNFRIELAGASRITSPPIIPSVPGVTLEVNSVLAGSVLEAVFTPDPVPAGFVLQLDATSSRSPGVAFWGNSDFRRVDQVPAAGTSPEDFSGGYVGVFGTMPSLGGAICVRVRLLHLASGWVGPWVSAKAITTAT